MSESARDILVRRAVTRDAPQLAHMRAASSFERKGGDTAIRDEHARVCEAFFARELADPKSFLRSWVAVAGRRIVGGASLAVVPTLPRYSMAGYSGFDGRVRDVYVEPELRGRGIARALMAAVIADARALRVDRLSLGASEMGKPLYLKIGFVFKTDEMVFEEI